MKKILLTSTGFDNINIKNKFIDMLNRDIDDIKILFIITAANDPDSVRILSGCLDDLTSCNIKDSNIYVYDMHTCISKEEITKYDAIYVCGGSTKKLVSRIIELNMVDIFNYYINNGGIYIGVSAGTLVAHNPLNFISNNLDVHCEVGSNNGLITNNDDINLTDKQAILITDNEKIIFE